MSLEQVASVDSEDKNSRWRIPRALMDRCVQELEKSLVDGTLRDKQTTASILKGMVESNLKHDEFEDKKSRLDAGTPTEISDQASLGAAAVSLIEKLDGLGGKSKIVKSDTDLRIGPPEDGGGSVCGEDKKEPEGPTSRASTSG